ncbi:MAG: insulinase family protein [Bacteroidales bacterium]|nr:insulinase family protein [Candidatus Cryptobacteroides aphodequi]
MAFSEHISKNLSEANAVIGAKAPSLRDKQDRITAVLLANILGGPASNSLLGESLRERHGWVYGVECSYTQYADDGIMAICLGCDRANLDKCLRETRRIIARFQKNIMSPERLAQAKKQLLGQLAISGEGCESQCLSMGKSLLAFGRVATDEENRRAIEAVTAEDLRDMALRIFADPSTLVYD